MISVFDGQLAASATALYTAPNPAPGGSNWSTQADVTLRNTSGSTTQTVTLKVNCVNGGSKGATDRQMPQIVLKPNEGALVVGLPLMAGDILKGQTSNATTVDCLVAQSETIRPFAIYVFDQNGNVKTSAQTPVAAAPVGVGSSLTLTASNNLQPILLNTVGGSTVTLPAATGTGNTFYITTTATTTSGAHKILAASGSDFVNGIAYGWNGSTAKVFGSAASTNHSIQMPFAGSQPSGGFIGDWFICVDVATNLWNITCFYQAGTTPTTPYSTATS